ncbi:hypothetical protein [Silvibacterium dinghuense]|uniref:Uncharacterized protein n=1 Tax=Silvibacterium dinghuense TaxID=1560006 RepID=A0A4Q1SI19_9BACT|nr:hypothetical protein [Silvibacterium dinghuense]RXS97251.1 hypothetical protein ESZ00_04885 [Silvibacterium dinghuense]GGG97476.1 hypothetical protein GCM10011586_10950 [Silvibacterium dinghuense]
MGEETKSGAEGSSGGEKEPVLSPDAPSLPGAVWSATKQTAGAIAEPTSKDGVFTGAWKVVTGQNSYEIDKAEAMLKSLQPASIAQAEALTGISPGAHQHIIRGDSVYHFLKNRLRYVDGNEGLFVKGTQTEQITKDAKLEYLADRKIGVKADDELSVFGQQDTYILGKSTEQYVGQHEVTAPEEFEWKQLERGFSALKLDLSTFGLDIHAANGDIHVVDAEATVFEAKGGTFKEIIEAQRMNVIALIVAGALELDVILRGDLAPDYGVGTPFR